MGLAKKYTIFVLDHQKPHHSRFRQAFKGCQHLVCFCETVGEMLALFKGVLPDIIFCNIQTPQSDATSFLCSIKQHCSHAIRIIFSEEDEEVNLMKLTSAGLAHRYLCLPRDRTSLKEVVDNAIHIRSRVRVRKCWDFIQSGRGLPSLPRVVRDLEAVMQRPEVSLAEVAKIVESDPALTCRLLQIVNSAAFHARHPIQSLQNAVTYLGLGLTRKLVLFLCSISHFQYPRKFHLHVLDVINHSIQCAHLAATVAEEIAPGEEKLAATAGLLHDIGKLVFLSTMDESLANSDSFLQKYRPFATEFEELTFGISHQEMGSALMLWWNLPLAVVDSALSHSQPLHSLTGVAKSVAIADKCLLQARFGDLLTTDLEDLDRRYPLPLWRQKAFEMVKTFSSAIEIAA